MNFELSFSDGLKDDDIIFDEIPFQLEPERASKKRSANDLSDPSTDDHTNQISMPFPEQILGQQMKQKTQTNVVSKKASVYISAVMEGISKFVLGKAGEDKDNFILPENRCIRVEDVEKVLSSVGVPDQDCDLVSREYLQGETICIDSINDSILEHTESAFSTIFKDYINVYTLPVNPSPFLQDYILQQSVTPDGVIITTYCERVETALHFQKEAKQLLIIPRSLRLLLAISMAHGKLRQQGLLLLKNYVNDFHEHNKFTADIFVDADDNSRYYTDYNLYRRGEYQRQNIQFFKLEVEQLVFYKIIRDLLKGRWIIVIPRYCHPESWEYEAMLKVATGRIESFQRCSVQLEFNIKSLNTRGSIVYNNAESVMKKYTSLKKFNYISPWNEEECSEKSQTVLCNLGLLCLCPIELIPVLYHHLYYQNRIILFSSLAENHPSIRNILELIRGSIL